LNRCASSGIIFLLRAVLGTALKNDGLCMPCALRRRHYVQHSSTAANPDHWSEASKRSRNYDDRRTRYFDEYFWCKCCGAAAVFRAEEQQVEYEVRKTRIYWKPTLCKPWTELRQSIKAELSEIMSRWKTERETLSRDRMFLESWLRKLEDLSRLTKHTDGRIAMIQQLLARLL
jgi:hypothetical protein